MEELPSNTREQHRKGAAEQRSDPAVRPWRAFGAAEQIGRLAGVTHQVAKPHACTDQQFSQWRMDVENCQSIEVVMTKAGIGGLVKDQGIES